MGLSITDAADVALQSTVADMVFEIIDDGYQAGGRIEETRSVYPQTEGLPFELKLGYADHEDLNGYTVDCVLTAPDGRDVTLEYIEGTADVIRGQFSSMEVEVQTSDTEPGAKLVSTVVRRYPPFLSSACRVHTPRH